MKNKNINSLYRTTKSKQNRKEEILDFNRINILQNMKRGNGMEKLVRVGTAYIPVTNVEKAVYWYTEKLQAELSYKDGDKAIINLANQSFFLVKAKEGETANFVDAYGNIRFSMTFEVDGYDALVALHEQLKEVGVEVGDIEDRGH